MSPKLHGAKIALLAMGQRLRGPKLHGAKIEGTFTARSFGPLNLYPAKFWTPQPVPPRVLEHCNLCPENFWRHSFRSQYSHKNM